MVPLLPMQSTRARHPDDPWLQKVEPAIPWGQQERDVGQDLDPVRLRALALARAEVRRLEAELGVSGVPGAAPAHPAEAATWWMQVAHLSKDFISVHASNGDYLFASPSSTRLLGWTPEQLCGTNAYTYFHPDDLAGIANSHASHGGGTGNDRVRYRIRCADECWRWVETTSHSHRTPEAVQRIVCSTRAVDEQVALEAQLQESNARLTRFASLIAHDIKSPLATIAGISEMLSMTAADRLDDLERMRLGQVHEAAMRLGGLVDSLLSWAQFEGLTSRPELTDLDALARRVLRDLQPDVDRCGATVAVGALPTVKTDPALTGLLLQNLVANALKFNHPGRTPEVRIQAEQGGTAWRLTVEDNGPGVPLDQHEQIFELYGRAGGGTAPGQGIGLAVCARIAHTQGGRIWVESEPGQGACFIVEFPKAQPAPVPV